MQYYVSISIGRSFTQFCKDLAHSPDHGLWVVLTDSNNLGWDADRCGKEGVTHKPQRDELSQLSLLWTYDNAVRAVPCHVLCQCSACCAMPYAVPVQRVLCYALCCDTAAACCA